MDGVMSGGQWSISALRHTVATRHLGLLSAGNMANDTKVLALISFHLN